MSIRLIAIDIDGTLLDPAGGIPDENRRAIASALDRGIEVALVTGRGYSFALPVAERLGLPIVLVASNGAIVRRLDGTTLLRRLMPQDVARDLLAQTALYRHEAAVVFDRPAAGQLVSGGLDWTHPSRAGYYGKHAALIAETVPLEACLVEDPVEVMFTGGLTRMRELIATLAAAPAAHRYAVSFVEYAWRDFILVDVLGAGVTKGTTLAGWAQALGLDYAGTGVAMGNSVVELLDGSFHVTGSNAEAGLAQAIERFALDT